MPTKERTTRVIEREIPDNGKPDPIAQKVKAYLDVEDMAIEEIADQYEWVCKAQKLDARGKVRHGMVKKTTNLLTVFDDILDDQDYGPGRYTIFVNFRPVGSDEKPKLVKVEDISIGDDDGYGAPPASPAGPAVDLTSAGILQLMMNQMNNTTTMIVEQSKANATILAAALGGRGSGAPEGRTIIEAVRTGAELGGSAAPPAEHHDDEPVVDGPVGGLLRFANRILDLLDKTPDGQPVDRNAIKGVIDEEMKRKGFEVVAEKPDA